MQHVEQSGLEDEYCEDVAIVAKSENMKFMLNDIRGDTREALNHLH